MRAGYFVIGLGWIPVIALAAWWAGFMPFPTSPGDVGIEASTMNGIGGASSAIQEIVSVTKVKNDLKKAPYGPNAWFCDEDNKSFCHLYQISEVPFYGWITPRWILTAKSFPHGSVPLATYGTYAACQWNSDRKGKAAEEQRVNYERWAIEQHQKVERTEYEFFSCVKMPT